MFFETRVDPPSTSPEFQASAEALLAGRVRDARTQAPARAVDAGDALLAVDILRAECRERRARALAVAAARRFPGHALLALEAARARVAQGQLARAEAALAPVAPGDIVVDARAGALRAVIAAAAGRDDDARAGIARFGIVADAVVEHDLGRAAALLGDLAAAVAHLERARALAPRFCGAALALCEVFVVEGKLDDADRVLADFTRRGDEDLRVDVMGAAIDTLRGSGARAAARLDEARARWPRVPAGAAALAPLDAALGRAAAAARSRGRVDDAERLDRFRVALGPDDAPRDDTPFVDDHDVTDASADAAAASDTASDTAPTPRAPLQNDDDSGDEFQLTAQPAASDTEKIVRRDASDTEKVRRRQDSDRDDPVSAAADWSRSRAVALASAGPPPSPWPMRITAAVAAALVVAVVVFFAAREAPPPPEAAVAVDDAAAVAAARAPKPKPREDPAPPATFAARARSCRLTVPAVPVGGPVDALHPSRCTPLTGMLWSGDTRAQGWRRCAVDGGDALVRADGTVAGVVLDKLRGTVADVVPWSLELGALHPASEDTRRARAVVSEAECHAVTLLVHATCAPGLVRFRSEKGVKVASPAMLPSCRPTSIYVVNGFL